jgi:translation initiation factor IF-3
LIVSTETSQNENRGIVSTREALQIAYERNLDLVEVSPNADPPVCRVMDFSKFLYERSKKEREARKAQKQIEVKEIRLRPKTNDHHLGFKVRDARRWIGDGMKVRVRIKFRGREITYPELARNQLYEIAQSLQDVAIIEQQPNMDGRTMLMVLAPIPADKDVKKPAPPKEAAPPAPRPPQREPRNNAPQKLPQNTPKPANTNE